MKRRQVYYADLRPVVGSEQGGIRPCLIIQNDMGNTYSPTVIVANMITQKFASRNEMRKSIYERMKNHENSY